MEVECSAGSSQGSRTPEGVSGNRTSGFFSNYKRSVSAESILQPFPLLTRGGGGRELGPLKRKTYAPARPLLFFLFAFYQFKSLSKRETVLRDLFPISSGPCSWFFQRYWRNCDLFYKDLSELDSLFQFSFVIFVFVLIRMCVALCVI